MTMIATQSYSFATLNGFQSQIPISFRFFSNNDVEAYLNGALTTAYTLAGAGNPLGGTLTFLATPVANSVAFIRRVTSRTQPLDYQANDPFDAESHEAALDRLCAQVQDLLEELSRRPALAVSTVQALRGLTFPAPVNLGLIGWNADGTALTTFASTIQQVTVNPSSGEAHGISTATLTPSGGEWSLVASALIPAGSKVKGVGYRVLTELSTANGLTSVDLGGLGVESGWGRQLGLTAATVNNAGHWRGDMPNALNASDVTLLANGGPFASGGSVKLTAFWCVWTPSS